MGEREEGWERAIFFVSWRVFCFFTIDLYYQMSGFACMDISRDLWISFSIARDRSAIAPIIFPSSLRMTDGVLRG